MLYTSDIEVCIRVTLIAPILPLLHSPPYNTLLKVYVRTSKSTSSTSVCRHRRHRRTDVDDIDLEVVEEGHEGEETTERELEMYRDTTNMEIHFDIALDWQIANITLSWLQFI